MEKLEKTLQMIQELIKKIGLLPSPKPPQAPMAPTGAPASKKDPVKVAQQIKDPSQKKQAVKQAKEIVKVGNNGQWKIDKV